MFAIMCSRLSGPHSVPSSEAGPKRRSKAGARCGARGWCEMSGSLAEAIASKVAPGGRLVLSGLLGYDASRIDSLIASGAVEVP